MNNRIMLYLVLGLLVWLAWQPRAVSYAQEEATPTPPPPPLTTPTQLPQATQPPNPGGGGKKPTPTATRFSGGGGVPPTIVPGTPILGSPTPTPTQTETLTPTLTPTPTLPPTLLRLVVYMDANNNGEFDSGEGVDHLFVLAKLGETWLKYGYTANGILVFTLPPETPAGMQIAVETPYLHWSKQVKAPEQSGQADAILILEPPKLPVFLP